MQMRTGAPSGATNQSDDIAPVNPLPLFDEDFGKVSIAGTVSDRFALSRIETPAVPQNHQVPKTHIFFRVQDNSVGGSKDGTAGAGHKIQPSMIFLFSCERIPTFAIAVG